MSPEKSAGASAEQQSSDSDDDDFRGMAASSDMLLDMLGPSLGNKPAAKPTRKAAGKAPELAAGVQQGRPAGSRKRAASAGPAAVASMPKPLRTAGGGAERVRKPKLAATAGAAAGELPDVVTKAEKCLPRLSKTIILKPWLDDLASVYPSV